jgi:hypothetical protein
MIVRLRTETAFSAAAVSTASAFAFDPSARLQEGASCSGSRDASLDNVFREGTSITGAVLGVGASGTGGGAPDEGASLVGESESTAWGVAGTRVDSEEDDTEPVAAATMREAVPAPAVDGFSFFAVFSCQVLCSFFCMVSSCVGFFVVAFSNLSRTAFLSKGVTRWGGIA